VVARKITWTKKANLERKEILAYWIEHNQSKTYSLKLNKLIKETLQLLSENPYIGRKSDYEHVRIKILRDYLIFYTFNERELFVLSLWDSRRKEQKIIR